MAPAEAATVVVPETKAKKSLVWIGAVLIAMFVIGVAVARLVGSESEETSSPTTDTTATAQVTKTTKTKDLPSDTLLTAVLATGGVLIVVGLLYSRISAIKLPGGGEITLTTEEKEKVAAKVAEKVSEGRVEAEAAPQVTLAALDQLTIEKQAAVAPQLPDAQVEATVEAVVQRP